MKNRNGLVDLLIPFATAFLLVMASCVSAGEPVGHVLMASGQAVRLDTGGKLVQLADKAPVYEGDTVQTREGVLQIKMVDNALLVLQAKTSIVITRYQFDAAAPQDNAVRIDLVEGRVRSVTGDLGQSNHDAFRLNTPIAAIGIRGTDFETTTTEELTRVRLNSGAIVISSLGDDCSVSSLGPCSSEGSLLLTEDLSSPVAELRASDSAPRLLQLPEYDDDQSSIRKSEEEEQAAVEENADKVVRRFSESPDESDDGGFTPVEVPAEWEDNIHWGRWSSVTYLDGKTVTELVNEDKDILFRNHLFALFRDGFLSLDKGQASFGLHSAQAGIIEGEQFTPVLLADGSLMIDFDDRYFETGLEFAGGSVDGLVLQASGSVDGQGLLRSDSGDMWVGGALSGGNSQAGYLFDHRLNDTSSLQGATQWQRH